MADGKRVFAKATSWLGLFCGVFTIIVWCFLLKALSPKIKVDKNDALNDINKGFWRTAMFTFAPSVFFDIWTPFVMVAGWSNGPPAFGAFPAAAAAAAAAAKQQQHQQRLQWQQHQHQQQQPQWQQGVFS
ncbi:hypothetical protein ACSSS7_001228 [Eimeria intestinalis]